MAQSIESDSFWKFLFSVFFARFEKQRHAHFHVVVFFMYLLPFISVFQLFFCAGHRHLSGRCCYLVLFSAVVFRLEIMEIYVFDAVVDLC